VQHCIQNRTLSPTLVKARLGTNVLWHDTPSNTKHSNVRAFGHGRRKGGAGGLGYALDKIKCNCIVQSLKNEYQQSACVKARTHILLDFVHLSKNMYTFLEYGLEGRNVTLNLVVNNTRSPRQAVPSPAPNVVGHTQSLHV